MSLTLTYGDVDFAALAVEAKAARDELKNDFDEAWNADWINQVQIDNAYRALVEADQLVADIESEAIKVGALVDGVYHTGRVAPAGAVRLDYRHIELMLKRLRKAGYQFSKVSAGEYGGELGRAHWHVVLMFEHDPAIKAKVLDAVANNQEWTSIQPPPGWQEQAPPFVANLRGKEFTEAIKDRDLLVVSYPQKGRKTAKIRNTAWRYWPHGIVQCEIAKAPGFNHPDQIEGAVRYPMKYLSKDAWKDSRKYQQTPFEELPEHIKHQTRFGPWKDHGQIAAEWQKQVALGQRDPKETPQLGEEWRKWSYGNPYVKRLEKELADEYGNPELAPLERQLCKGLYNYKKTGGLGGEYFAALGRQIARNHKTDPAGRGFQVGANYRMKRTNADRISKDWTATASAGAHQLFVNPSTGETVLVPRQRFNHVMGDTSYRSFWRGYNSELEDQGLPATAGPDDVVETLQTSKAMASDSSSGSFGHSLWRKLSWSGRRTVEQRTAMMPNRDLKGLFPARWIKNLEETSHVLEWRLKGLERMRIEYLRSLERIHNDPSKITDETGDKDAFVSLRVYTEEALSLAIRQRLSSSNTDPATRHIKHIRRIRAVVEHHLNRCPELQEYWPDGWLSVRSAEPGLDQWETRDYQERLHAAQAAKAVKSDPIQRRSVHHTTVIADVNLSLPGNDPFARARSLRERSSPKS